MALSEADRAAIRARWHPDDNGEVTQFLRGASVADVDALDAEVTRLRAWLLRIAEATVGGPCGAAWQYVTAALRGETVEGGTDDDV